MKIICAVTISILVTRTASVLADDMDTRITDVAYVNCAGVSTECGDAINPKARLKQLAQDAISPNTRVSKGAIELLRAAGPEGLQVLLDEHGELLKSRPLPLIATANPVFTEQLTRLHAALDAVGQQRDCHASGLYWYTDFDQVKAAAKASGKSILSLRLLGRLDEEFSCANSRFFRTTLYANKEVSAYLRDRFVLHWKSVRPVPKVTIDFGDGRKLERTITGNSIHYVLAGDGRVIDALPGLYGPKAFLDGLQQAEGIAQQCATVDASQREAMLGEYHRARFASLKTELEADLQKVSAADSLRRPAQSESGPAGIGDATWSKIAALHEESSNLDAGARALIRAKSPTAFDARRAAFAKMIVEDPLLRQIRNLERSTSEDTVRNEYLLHPKIHAWLASGEMSNVDELNRKVYAELFLTPDTDPWLGLMPQDTYTALENNGLVQTVKR